MDARSAPVRSSAPAGIAAPPPGAVTSLMACLLSSLGRHVDVLELRVVVERVRAELTTHAGLLEAPERCRHAHRRVRVDRDRSCLQAAGDTNRLRAVAGPDRAREAVDRVVRD